MKIALSQSADMLEIGLTLPFFRVHSDGVLPENRELTSDRNECKYTKNISQLRVLVLDFVQPRWKKIS